MACGLTIIKRFSYKGNSNEEWSNHYWLTGATPADSAAWRTLFDALVAEEKKLFQSSTTIVAGYGYDSTAANAHAVWTVDMTVSPNAVVPGTYVGGGIACGGDTAVWVRWGLDRLNSKGKRIFLRKYFHPAIVDVTAQHDGIVPALLTALTSFGAKMDDGSLAGGRKITDKLGTNTVGHAVAPYATTRTLKRRGKRPPT